jgi:Ca2+-binding RTX toxin-like protein
MAAFTTLQQSTLVQLYVGVLGTTPTTTALNNYATIFMSATGNETAKFDAVASAMVASAAGQAKYPVFATASQVAETMLGHIGIDLTKADFAALKTEAVAILSLPGMSVATFGNLLLNALNKNTFTGTDPVSMAAAAAKAAYGVDGNGVPGTTLTAAVDAALGKTPVVNTPQTFSLGTSADDLAGGAGDDTFTGLLAATGGTVNTGDKIDGKAGQDTLAITNTATSSQTLELKSVETVQVKQVESATLEATLWADVTRVVAKDGLASMTLSVNNLQAKPSFTIEGGSTVSTQTLNASYIELTGASDSAEVTFTGVSAANANLATSAGALETITISNTQSSGATTLAGTAVSATSSLMFTGSSGPFTLNVSDTIGNVSVTGAGSGNINLNGTGSSTQVITFTTGDARITVVGSGNKTVTTGDSPDTVTLRGNGSGDVNITLGAGNDSLTVSLAGNAMISAGDGADTIDVGGTAAGDTIKGGSGADVLVMTLATGINTPLVTEVETFSVTPSTGRTLNLSNVDDLATITFASAITSGMGASISNADATLKTINMEMGATTSRLFYATNANGDLTVNASAAAAGTTLTLDEVATFKLNASGNGSMTINLDADDTTATTLTLGCGGAVMLGNTSALATLTIASVGGSAASVGITGSANPASALTAITLSSTGGVDGGSDGSLTFSSALGDAPYLSTVSLTAGSGVTITMEGFTTSAADMSPSVAISVGSASTVSIENASIAYAAAGTLTISASGSGGTVLLGQSAIDDLGRGGAFYSSISSTKDVVLLMGTATNVSTASGMSASTTVMTITGGTGADRLIGGPGADTISGGAGNDSLVGGAGNDSLLGGAGNDSIIGMNGADTINGGTGDDTVSGISGADVIYIGQNDSVTGGSGADVYIMNTFGGASADKPLTIVGFNSGNDEQLDFTGTTNAVYIASTSALGSFSAQSTGLFGSADNIKLHYVAGWDNSSASGVTVDVTGLDMKSAADFALVFGASNAFAANTASFDGQSGNGVGLTGASAAVAAVMLVGTADTLLVFLQSTGSGTQTLSTANVVDQILLTGWVGTSGQTISNGDWG